MKSIRTGDITLSPVILKRSFITGMNTKTNTDLKKKITIASLILIAACFVLTIIVPHVMADEETGPLGWFSAQSTKLVSSAFIDLLGDSNNATSIYTWLCGAPHKYTQLPRLANTYYANARSVIKTIGAMFAIAATLGKLFNKLERGQEGTQLVISSLSALCITGLVIMNIDKITGVIGELGRQICVLFVQGETPSEVEINEYVKASNELLGGQEAGGLAYTTVNSIKGISCGLGCIIGYYACYIFLITKMIEIGILRLFAPLAVYDIYEEGLRSNGGMYFKSILAAYLSIAMSAFVGSVALTVGEFFVSYTDGVAGASVGGAAVGGTIGGLVGGPLGSAAGSLIGALAATIGTIAKNAKNDYDGAISVLPFVPTLINITCARAMTKTEEYAKRVLGVH